MATRKDQKVIWQRHSKRIFSESFKKQKVKEIERNLCTVLEVSRSYDISRSAVYKWLDKYSMTNKQSVRLIVEPMSDTKKIKELQARIKELEQLVGQKQIQIEFTEKMIELAEERYQIDIKKKVWFETLQWYWFHREEHPWKMNEVYRAIGTSKQNVHQRLNRAMRRWEQSAQLERVVDQIRRDHPAMGMKALYVKLKPFMGRDAFFEWYRTHGFKLQSRRNWRRTTDSSGVVRFNNLTEGLKLTGVNQLWVSDITYYELKDKFCYLTFIMDQFSRKIKGYSVSASLHTQRTTMPALRMALKHLAPGDLPIFHSDGGGQYYSKAFLELTKNKFRNSMGKTAYENPYAERLNRTIKNDYIRWYNPLNFKALQHSCKKAVKMYNLHKPHSAIKGYTPEYYEQLMTTNSNMNNRPETVNLN